MSAGEFTVESLKHCFICLDPISTQFSVDLEHGPGLQARSIHSLSILSSYLKMDMGKVFHNNVSIPQQLLDKVRKAKLKGELCDECSLMNDEFSGLYWKLIKIEMELASSLQLFQDKFLKANKSGKSADLRSLAKSMVNAGGGWMGKLDILDVLRAEAIDRCSQKQRSSDTLRVKVQNMTRNQIIFEQEKFRSTIETKLHEPNLDARLHLNKEDRNVKTEFPFELPMPNDIDDSCYSDNSNNTDCFEEFPQGSITPQANEGEYRSNISLVKVEDSSTNRPNQRTMEKFKSQSGTRENLSVKYSFEVVIPPESQTVPKPRPSVNTESGKHKCNLCPSEFTNINTFKIHYESVHLKVKYKCKICERQFTQRSHYLTHYRSSHLGIRFKCQRCNKLFTDKSNLRTHQRNACRTVGASSHL